MSGRFQVFTTSTASDAPLRWRLISENGRPLATSAGAFTSYEHASLDAAAVRDWLPQGRFLLSIQDRGGWGWEAVVGSEPGTPRARSARRYARRVECLRAVNRFSDLGLVSIVGSRAVAFPPALSAVPHSRR